MLILDLQDGTRIAVRPSGTEPKIKYYLFARRQPEGNQSTGLNLDGIKVDVEKHLEDLWNWLRHDAESRLQTEPNAATN